MTGRRNRYRGPRYRSETHRYHHGAVPVGLRCQETGPDLHRHRYPIHAVPVGTGVPGTGTATPPPLRGRGAGDPHPPTPNQPATKGTTHRE